MRRNRIVVVAMLLACIAKLASPQEAGDVMVNDGLNVAVPGPVDMKFSTVSSKPQLKAYHTGAGGSYKDAVFTAKTMEFQAGTSPTGAMWIDSSGMVGIGVTNALQMFHVHKASGDAYAQFTNTASGSGSGNGLLFGLATSTADAKFLNRMDADMFLGTNNKNMLVFDSGASGAYQVFIKSGASNNAFRVDVDSSGNTDLVQIGQSTTVPVDFFKVFGYTEIWGNQSLRVASDTLNRDLGMWRGRVASGGNPVGKVLDGNLLGQIKGGGRDGDVGNDTSEGHEYGGAMRFYCDGDIGTNEMPVRIEFWTLEDDVATTTNSETMVRRMVIKDNGNVGIGEADPANTFVVKTLTDGGITLNGGDEDVAPTIKFQYEGDTEWEFGAAPALGNKFVVLPIDYGLPSFAADTNGNVSVGGGVGVWGTSAQDVFAINEGTTPTSSPSNIVQLYAVPMLQSSSMTELRVRDEAGNATTLSPHNRKLLGPPDPTVALPWTYYSRNDYVGYEQNVDMAAVIRAVEQLTGEEFIKTRELPMEEIQGWYANQQAEKERIEAERLQAGMNEEIECPKSEAVEEYEVMGTVKQIQIQTGYQLDAITGDAVEVEQQVEVDVPVGTGQMRWRLKKGARLDAATGTFYRKKAAEEVEIEPYQIKDPPQWILDRLQAYGRL